MFTVLVTASSLAASGVSRLQEAQCRILYAASEAEVERLLAAEPVDAVISRTLDLKGPAIHSCASLKVISKHGSGYNNVDVDAATARAIPVFFTPGANAQAVAELTIGLAISVARSLPIHSEALHRGGWTRATAGLELSGRTLGIIGLGRIGSLVAKLAQAFGMKVIALDPNPEAKSPTVEKVGSLAELLLRAQILTLHCPLTRETRGMIGAAELALLPRDAIVLNAARAGIVDEMALAEALGSKHLFGAAIDNFEEEPLPAGHPFLSLPNMVMTPHIGGSTGEALDTVAVMAAQNALAFLKGEPVDERCCVNPSVLSRKTTVTAL